MGCSPLHRILQLRALCRRNSVTYVGHLVAAMVASVIIGGVLAALVQHLIGDVGPKNWTLHKVATDAPYSPLLWGSALLLGLVVNRRTRNRSACWIWVAGLCWLGLWIWDAVSIYDPRWCQGCSLSQNVWRNFFTVGYNSCLQDCLAELFGTTPTLNSIAYSIGAWIAIKRYRGHALVQ